jgi:hypothetical protein
LLAARQDLCGCLVKLKANLRVSLWVLCAPNWWQLLFCLGARTTT